MMYIKTFTEMTNKESFKDILAKFPIKANPMKKGYTDVDDDDFLSKIENHYKNDFKNIFKGYEKEFEDYYKISLNDYALLVSMLTCEFGEENSFEYKELQDYIISDNYKFKITKNNQKIIQGLKFLQVQDDVEISILFKDIDKFDSFELCKGFYDVSFNNCNLDDFDFKQIQYVKEIVIKYSNTTTINDTIGSLKELKELAIYENLNLKNISKNIGLLKKLKKLVIRFNDSKRFPFKFPDTISDLTNLEIAILKDSSIDYLPNFSKLNKLIQIFISNCSIKEIPLELYNLKNLHSFYINSNDIKKIGVEILNANPKFLGINFEYSPNITIAKEVLQSKDWKVIKGVEVSRK